MGVPLAEDGETHIPPAQRSDFEINSSKEHSPVTFSNEYYARGYKAVLEAILPHLSKLVSDIDHDVRKAASDSLAGVASYLQSSDVTSLVLPIALRLIDMNSAKVSHNSGETEDLRIASVTLLAELASAVSSETLTEKILPTFAPLSQDNGFRVRKAVVHAIPRVLAYADVLDIKTYLLPLFDSLSKDDMYRVRKACAESMVEMSGGVVIVSNRKEDVQLNNILHLRRTILIPICTRLLKDSNRFVRHGMMQFLGPFVASFFPLEHISSKLPGESVPNYFPHSSSPFPIAQQSSDPPSALKSALTSDLMLLEKVFQQRALFPPDAEDLKSVKKELIPHFSSMAVLQSGDANTDAEMRVHCAYSLPAALLLLGREEWDLLRGCFFALVNGGGGSADTSGNISAAQNPPTPILAAKRCLASSLHTLAHILGPEIVESELLPTFSHSFLRDPDEHTRLNTLKNLSSFLAVLSPKARESFLPIFLEFKNSAASQRLNWRLRNIVTKQLSLLISLFDAKVIKEYLLPLMYTFVKDSVAQVREETFVCVPVLLFAFSPEKVEKTTREKYLRDSPEGNLQDWAANASHEVVTWLREELGRNDKDFCMRQAFCRICAAIAMAITEEFGEENDNEDNGGNSYFDDTLTADGSTGTGVSSITQPSLSSPTNRFIMTQKGKKYLHKILVHDLISTALRMKDDSVSNVRLTLFKCLRVMPDNVRSLLVVNAAMRQLAEELNTWDMAEAGGLKIDVAAPTGNYAKQKKKSKDNFGDGRSVQTLSTSSTSSYGEGQRHLQTSGGNFANENRTNRSKTSPYRQPLSNEHGFEATSMASI